MAMVSTFLDICTYLIPNGKDIKYKKEYGKGMIRKYNICL